MLHYVLSSAPLKTYTLFDCVLKDAKLKDDRRLTVEERFELYVMLLKGSVDAKRYLSGFDDEYTWQVEYTLRDNPNGYDANLTDEIKYCFRTIEERTTFERLVIEKQKTTDVDLCLEAKLYDERTFELGCMVPVAWLMERKKNLWKLAGFFHRRPYTSVEVMCRTFLCLSRFLLKHWFHYERALEAFECWNDPTYTNGHLTETMIENMAKDKSAKQLKAWKKKYGADDDDGNPKKLKEALYEAILDELKQLPSELISADNEYYCKDFVKQRDWDDFKRFAYALKSSYAYVWNHQVSFFIIKTFGIERYGDNDSVRTITYQQGGVGSNSTMESKQHFKVEFKGNEIKVNLRELLLTVHYGIWYDFANVIPYSPKVSRNVADGTFNMFPIYQHTYDPDYVPNQEIVELFDTQVRRYLCNGDERVGKYALDWFAFTLQKPHVKTGTSLLFKSKQGAGKNFTFNFIARYVLSPMMCAVVTDMNRLTGRFDNIGPGKKLVLVDEALDGNRANAQVFKNLITETRQPLERKGEQTIYVDDFRNYMVATNNDFSSVVEESCRRFVCIECSDAVCPFQPGAHEYWENMAAKLLTVEAGRSIFHWLLQRDLSDFNVRKIPDTKYKRELKLRMANPVVHFLIHKHDKWVEEEKTNEEEVSHDDLFREYKAWREECMPSATTLSDYRFGSLLNERGLTLGKPKAVPWSNKKMKFRVLSVAILAEALKCYIAGEDVITDDD